MRLTSFDIIDQGGPAVIRAWLSEMNLECKTKFPVFKVSGPMDWPCRVRQVTKASTQSVNFMGGEKLTLSSIYSEPSHMADGQQIKVTLVPAATDLKLVNSGLASMAMPLSDALLRFDGLEEWVSEHAKAAPKILAEKTDGQIFDVPLVTMEEFKKNENLGVW